MTEAEFFTLAAPLVAMARHGHMVAKLSKETYTQIAAETPLLPYGVRVIGGEVFIFRDLSGRAEDLAGWRIDSINGVPAQRLVRDIGATLAVDAGLPAPRDRVMSGSTFSERLELFGVRAPFDVVVSDDGRRKAIHLDGVKNLANALRERFPDDREVAAKSGPSLRIEDSAAILAIPHWDYGEEAAKLMETLAANIAASEAKALIIDIRDNHGGEEILATDLFAHFVDEPFRWYACAVFKSDHYRLLEHAVGESREYGALLGDYQKPAEGKCAEQSAFELANRSNLGLQNPREPRFEGPIYVLVDSGSFSTSVEFAAHTHSSGRGALIGEPPHGSYWSNDSGITPTIELPHSKMQIDIPLIHYLHELKSGLAKDAPVPVDIPVSYTIDDYLAGADKEMDAALKLARAAAD